MKKALNSVFITALIGLSNLVNAQAVVNNSLVPAALQEAEIGIQVPTPLVGLMMPNFQATNENVLFYEDFANGFDGNNGVGAWTAEDTGEGQIWQYVDLTGNGYYADGSASGAQPPAGEFSTNIGSLNSTTAANGWMIFDNDFYNTPVADGAEDTQGWITSPSLDFSASGSVIISWEQYFRYCCYGNAPIYIQVSNDGGANWITFDAHGTFIESANNASANALTTSVDISCVAANSADVQIRFSYLQALEGIGSGYSHYYWGIDDVTIFENITAHNLAITQVFNGDVYNAFEYNVTPMEQVAPESEGGVVVGVEFQNLGYATQQNVEAMLEIYDDFGAIVHTHIETLGVVPSTSDDVDCPSAGSFMSFFSSLWTPSDTGSYDMKIILSSENIEATILDNEMSKSIEYTLDEMGHDVEPLDYEFSPAQDDSSEDLYEPCGYGNRFLMQNEGSTVYGLNIKFGPNNGGADLNFATRLFDSFTDLEYESAYWNYNELVSSITYDSSEWVYLPFQTPIELNPGTVYSAAVMNDSASESQLTVMGNSTGDTDNSTIEYLMSGEGYFTWFSTQGGVVPAIRLVMSPQDFAGCTDSVACNFNSVATIDDGSCLYETCGCMDETACNYDADAEFDDGSCCVCVEAGITMDVYGLDYLIGTWQLSSAAGALSIGPEPLSGAWFSSPENGLEPTQYDDSWSFYPTGEFVYSNSGSTWTPWAGEVGATFDPASFEVSDNGPFFGEPTFSISSMLSNELGLVCGWFGTIDSGSDYEVVSLSETSLTVLGEYVDQGCNNSQGGFWTMTFERSEFSGFCIQGCFDEMACNYDPDVVVIDNEMCVYPGCEDPSASNYDSTAGCPSECLYVEFICADVGEEGWNLLESGTYPEWQEAVQGIAWSGEWVLNIAAEMEEPSTGVPYPLHHFEWTDLSGIPTWAEDVTFELGTVGPNEQRCISASGVPVLPGMHEIQVEGELFISIFGQPFSIGIQSYSAWLEVLDNPNPIPGCTYANAVNFLSYATDDDGSCLFGGCTDEAANNFNPIATIDDGSCGEECEPGVDSSCSTDANNDGTVSVADLLILLGEFGTTCE